MKHPRPFAVAVAAAAGALWAGAAAAQDCNPGKSGFDLTAEEAQAVYDCLEGALHEGYTEGPKQWIPEDVVEDYRDWQLASTHPAAPGFHAGRFLLTWVNDTGFDAYTEYAEDPDIPAGTWIAKESFSVGEDGGVTPGPLFIMQKVEEGTSPDTDDWYYMAVAASGTPMAVNVMTVCNECHMGTFGYQGGLGYPVPEARLGN